MSGKLKALGKATVGNMEGLIAPQVGRRELAYAVGYTENAGAPTSVTPDFIGQLLFDTSNSLFYRAYGVASGNWLLMGDVGLSAAELEVLDGAVSTNDVTGKAAITRAGPSAGVGITAGTGTIYRSSAIQLGGIIKTSILIDLTGLSSSTTDLDIIGVAGGPAHIGQITSALNGTILSGKMTCLEVPVGGADDIDLYYATEGTGEFDAGIATLVEVALITSGAAWTLALTKAFADPAGLAEKYLYLTGGEAGTAAAYTAGKFLIEIEGYVA